MSRKETKYILFLIGSLLTLGLSLVLAISHINYAVTYEEWYSYMTKRNAIIVSITGILIAMISVSLVIYSMMKIIRINKAKKRLKKLQ